MRLWKCLALMMREFKKSAYYRRVQPISEGLVFRDWLKGQPFEVQYEWGIRIMREFGVKVGR